MAYNLINGFNCNNNNFNNNEMAGTNYTINRGFTTGNSGNPINTNMSGVNNHQNNSSYINNLNNQNNYRQNNVDIHDPSV